MAENLASGNSINFQFDADDYISITGNAQVIASGPTASVNTTTTGGTFGPYQGGAAVRIIATGAVTYTLTQPSRLGASLEVVSAPGGQQTMSAPSLQVLANSGIGGRISALSSCTILGDSLLANGNPSAAGAYTTSHVMWANDRLAGIDVISYRAVGGKTLTEVIAEQLPGTLTDPTDIAWVHSGANSLDPDSVVADYRYLIGQLAAVKKLVLVDSIQPVTQTGGSGLRNRAYLLPSVNEGIRNVCSEFVNAVYLDTYGAMIDPASATMAPKSGYVVPDPDGIHFYPAGAQAAGYTSATEVSKRAKITPYRTKGANLLPALSGNGGTVTPGTGTITGTPPVNWNVEVVNGSASVTITEPVAGTTRLAITNAGGASSVVYLQLSPAMQAALFAAVGGATGGAVIQGEAAIQVSGITNCPRAGAVSFRRLGAAPTTFGAGNVDGLLSPAPNLPAIAFGGLRKTYPFPWGAGASACDFLISVQVGASTGAVTIDITSPKAYRLTA